MNRERSSEEDMKAERRKDEEMEDGGRGLIEREIEKKGQISGAVGWPLSLSLLSLYTTIYKYR